MELFDPPQISVDYIVRVVVSSALLGVSFRISRWVGKRLFGTWYTPLEDGLQGGGSVGLVAGFGIAHDYPAVIMFVGVVTFARFLHQALRSRQRGHNDTPR